MTNNQFMDSIEKRLANGLSILNAGDGKHYKMLTLALEVHRLLPYCPLVSTRYVFRMVYMKLNHIAPDKSRTHSFFEFYQLLEVSMGSHKWPNPKIPNNKHDGIRTKLQEINSHITSALDGEKLTAEQQRIVVKSAIDNAKQSIKDATENRKRQEKEAKIRKIALQAAERKQKAKIKNRGYHPSSNHEQTSLLLTTDHVDLPYCVSHKIRLSLNNRQKQYLRQCFGIARKSYNWCYDEWIRRRNNGERPFANEIIQSFMSISQQSFPYMYRVTHFAKKTGIDAFDKAVNNFFAGAGFPNRKHHGLGFGSLHYAVTDRKDSTLCDANPDIPGSKPSRKRQYLLIPTFGYVKMMEKLRFRGYLSSVTIKLEADDHYYAVLNVYIDQQEWKRTHKIREDATETPVGIDMGLSSLATLSNGIKIASLPFDEKLEKRKKNLQKAVLSRREAAPNQASKSTRLLQWYLAKTNAKLRRQREDYIHKVTSGLSYTYKYISVENLNVADMLKDNYVSAKSVIKANFYKFRKLLEQKTSMAGHSLHVADKFLPSTRTCSVCGCIGDIVPLQERTFHCKECGAEIDRDINAAINLAKLIGLDEPNLSPVDKGAITAALQACGVVIHQIGEEKQVGLQT